jgi:hypothetical protein
MAPKVTGTLSIENAKLVFRNFSGKSGQYNAEGIRNFCVFLDSKIAEDLEQNGWNIRWLEPRDPAEDRQAYMQIKVSYTNIPPKIIVITGNGKTILDEESVHVLDWAEISNVDMVINPYNWEVRGKHGVKGYLKTMYVTLYEDEFAKKYRNVPDAATSIADEDAD